jgi:hypothetical protein
MQQPRTPILPFAKRTVTDKRGNGDLGVITNEIALAIKCNPAVIRLLNGVEGRTGGFGLAHIEGRRIDRILGLGFADVHSYAHFIASGFTEIAIQEDGRLVLLREAKSLYHWLICQWDDELGIWSVTTVIPKPHKRELTVVWPIGEK